MSELKPKYPYVIENPRLDALGNWCFYLEAPVHVHLMLNELPFLRCGTVGAMAVLVERGRFTLEQLDSAIYDIHRMYDTEEAWLATVEAIDAYLAERAFEALWGSALEDQS